MKSIATLLALIAVLQHGYMAFADNSSSTQTLVESRSKTQALYLEAKKLIVDGFPEDRERAESLLLDVVRLEPYNAEAFAELSRFTLWQIANSILEPTAIYQASELATHVKAIAPHRPLGDYLACEILLAAGQYQQALKLFADVKTKYPVHIDTLVFEARFWSDIEPLRALESAQLALAQNYPMDDLSPAIAEALIKISEPGEAGDNLSRFAKIYPDRWLWHRAGLAYTEEKLPTKARGAFEAAIELGNTLESTLQLGILEYTELNEPEFASKHLEALKKALIARKGREDGLAMVSAHLASAKLEAGKFTEASHEAELAMSYGQASSLVVTSLVGEFSKRGRELLLRPVLERLVQKDPTQAFVHVTLGNIASKEHDYLAAVEHFSNAILLSPERDDLYSARGHARYAQFNYGEALVDFELAIRFKPESGSHRYNRACMLARLGRKSEAMEDLREAIALDRELKNLARSDEDLAVLRNDKTFASDLVFMGVLIEASADSAATR